MLSIHAFSIASVLFLRYCPERLCGVPLPGVVRAFCVGILFIGGSLLPSFMPAEPVVKGLRIIASGLLGVAFYPLRYEVQKRVPQIAAMGFGS